MSANETQNVKWIKMNDLNDDVINTFPINNSYIVLCTKSLQYFNQLSNTWTQQNYPQAITKSTRFVPIALDNTNQFLYFGIITERHPNYSTLLCVHNMENNKVSTIIRIDQLLAAIRFLIIDDKLHIIIRKMNIHHIYDPHKKQIEPQQESYPNFKFYSSIIFVHAKSHKKVYWIRLDDGKNKRLISRTKKKLREIEVLKFKHKSGVLLSPQQFAKIDRKQELEEQLNALKNGSLEINDEKTTQSYCIDGNEWEEICISVPYGTSVRTYSVASVANDGYFILFGVNRWNWVNDEIYVIDVESRKLGRCDIKCPEKSKFECAVVNNTDLVVIGFVRDTSKRDHKFANFPVDVMNIIKHYVVVEDIHLLYEKCHWKIGVNAILDNTHFET